MREVTLFITSCGRPELLKRTLVSFCKYNTYPIQEVIMCEDSGLIGCIDFAHDILPWTTTIYYNKSRIGLMLNMNKYNKFIKTPYVFHLEDDYEFFKGGFIEMSFEMMDSDSKISQVLLEESYYHTYPLVDYGNPLCYKVMTCFPEDKTGCYGDGSMSIYSWRPSLKKIEVERMRIPYEPWEDEYTLQLEIKRLGLYSVIPKRDFSEGGRVGYCENIGIYAHVPEDASIVKRADFPELAQIRYADYLKLVEK